MRWVAAVVAVVVAALLLLAQGQGEPAREPAPPSTTSTTARPPADLWGLVDEGGAYERSITRDLGTNEAVTRLRRVAPGADGFASLFLDRQAADRAGRRVRVEVDVRTVDAGAAGLTIRATYRQERYEVLATAALQGSDRLVGTGERRLAVELDVPAEATHLEVFVVLEGAGELVVGEWSLEAV